MDNRSLQRLLRDIDAITPTIAISGASGKTQAKTLKNVSRKMAIMLIDEMETLGAIIALEISHSQKRILETMHNLRKQGEMNI